MPKIEVYEGISYTPAKRLTRVDPEAHLPWRMWEHFGKSTDDATFILARSQESADGKFKVGAGLVASKMCYELLNPALIVLESGKPYHLFAFPLVKPIIRCCKKPADRYYVLAGVNATMEEARKRLDKYGMCAVCMCEMLCLDIFTVKTTDGGAP